MAKASEVLEMLCPGIQYVSYGQSYEDINWLNEKAPITKEQFEAGFAQVDAWKAQQAAEAAAKKTAAEAKLAALGLTADDLRALGLG